MSEVKNSVSIVIANLNGQHLLGQCLASIQLLDYPLDLLEVIVVDNASVDGSLYFLQREFPNVRTISLPKNQGYAQAINIGAEAAQGDYLFLLNNDATVHEHCLRALIEPLQANTCDCTTALIIDHEQKAIHFAGGGTNFHGIAFQARQGEPYDPTASPVNTENLFPCGAAMMIKRALFLAEGGFDKDFFAYFEDVDFGWRLKLHGKVTHVIPSAIVYHRESSTSQRIALPKLRLLHIRNPLMMIYKNYSDESIAKILPVALLLTSQRTERLVKWPAAVFSIGDEPQLAERPETALGTITPEISLPATAASDFIAISWWTKNFEQLQQKRQWVQRTRVVSDNSIAPLFREPFRYAEQDQAYRNLQDSLCDAFGINELFAK